MSEGIYSVENGCSLQATEGSPENWRPNWSVLAGDSSALSEVAPNALNILQDAENLSH